MPQVPIAMHDTEYATLLSEIYDYGWKREDRTGVGTVGLFGKRMQFDIRHRIPLLTGKKIHWKSVVEELFWFMRGETNTKTLNASIWDEWADEDGECGPIYGYQWRSWPCGMVNGRREWVDQLATVVNSLKNNPNSRRHIVSAWNVAQLDEMALPPCHLLFQFNVRPGGLLDCQMYQRSCDMFLGVPFNIASYSVLTYIIAHMTGLTPGEFIWVGGDCHIYKNHFEAVEMFLSRSFKVSPILRVVPKDRRTLDDWTFEDLELLEYDPHPSIKAEVAI